MGIEELKMILDTFSKVGEEAKELVIFYLILDYFVPFIVFLILVWGVGWVVKLMAPTNNHTEILKTWRDELKIGSKGALSDHEFNEMVSRISKLIQNRDPE